MCREKRRGGDGYYEEICDERGEEDIRRSMKRRRGKRGMVVRGKEFVGEGMKGEEGTGKGSRE